MCTGPRVSVNVLAVLFGLTLSARPLAAQSRSAFPFGPWQPMQWSVLEMRVKCDGGVLGVSDSPIRWTVQIHNRAKQDVSFNYQLVNPHPNKDQPLAGRTTLKPGRIFEQPVQFTTDGCDDTPRIRVGKVRYGADADSLPYAPPDHP
jgi:hypothetical protein